MSSSNQEWITLGGLETLVIEQGPAEPGRPILIAVHGHGASAEDLVPLLPEIFPGPVVGLFPNGPLNMPMGGWGIGHSWYEFGPGQAMTLRASVTQLTSLLDQAIDRFTAEPERVLLSGFSQGAVMTLEVGLRYKAKLGGLIALSGYLPEPDAIVSEAIADRALPILICHGTADEIVPVDAGRLAFRELRALGYTVEYREFPIGHHISADETVFIRDWITTHLGDSKSNH